MAEDKTQLNSVFDGGLREVRPLYWVLMASMLALYYWALRTTPGLLEPSSLIAFTTLLLVHALLHWFAPLAASRPQWQFPYFIMQAALIFSIVFMSHTQGFIYGLYWAMAGEAAMILADLRTASLTVVGYMILAAVNFVFQLGWGMLPALVAYMAPMAFFILVYALMFQRQAKARRETQSLLADLETAHRQLTEYAVRVEDLTLSSERERMARELHDTLAQGLAGLLLQLEAVDTHLSRSQVSRAQEIVTQAMARARAALADARRAIDDLRRRDGDLDLEASVRAEAERFTKAMGIPCELHLEVISRIPESTAEHAFKVVTEALTNIARHAHASKVSLQLEAHNGSLEIVITDDGSGFDADQQDKSGHYGLIGMRERARLAGGILDIHSQPGGGTILKLRLPLE